MWEARLSIVDWVYSKTHILLTFEHTEMTSERISCIFGSPTFVPMSWMCKKQASVSTIPQNQKSLRWMLDSEWMVYLLLTCGVWWQKCYVHRRVPNHQPIPQQGTVLEIANPNPKRETEMVDQVSHVDNVTADARMDHFLSTFGTWSLRCYVPQTALQDKVDKPKETCAGQENIASITKTNTPTKRRKRWYEQLSNVDCVPTNTHSSSGESQLYIFENNEAVIKMIIKGRSPTMRHLSPWPGLFTQIWMCCNKNVKMTVGM